MEEGCELGREMGEHRVAGGLEDHGVEDDVGCGEAPTGLRSGLSTPWRHTPRTGSPLLGGGVVGAEPSSEDLARCPGWDCFAGAGWVRLRLGAPGSLVGIDTSGCGWSIDSEEDQMSFLVGFWPVALVALMRDSLPWGDAVDLASFGGAGAP